MVVCLEIDERLSKLRCGKMKGANEKYLFEILNEAYPGKWVNEFRGIPNRKFRFDCACLEQKVAIEIEGGIWLGKNGGHTGGLGYQQNMEKYNLATLEGWKILRYSPQTLLKNPWHIIADVRKLCGGSERDINMANVKRKTTTLQVKLL